jgi:hypothetical protein
MKALNGQNIIDISIQESGSPEAAYEAAKKNSVELTDSLTGTSITGTGLIDKDIKSYYENEGVKPATLDTREIDQANRIIFEELSLEFF